MSTLFFRIYFFVLALVLVAFFLVFFIANTLFYSNILREDANEIYATISQSLKNKEQQQWQQEIAIYDRFTSEYELSLVNENELTDYERKQYVKDNENTIIPKTDISNIDLYVLHPFIDSPWLLKVSEGDSNDNSINDLLDIIIIFILVFLAFALGLYLLMRAITKPIKHLDGYAQKIGQGDLSVQITESYPAPLDNLANSFNTMTDQLNASLQEQQVLIGAIPHELRTPLSKIRFALDITRNRNTIESLRQDIEQIDRYADQMEETVDDILELNRLQNQSVATLTEFDLCDLLTSIAASAKQDSPTIEINIKCEMESTFANVPLLKRALQNLLNNAQRHAKSVVHINVWQQQKTNIVQIEDDGKGINEKQMKQLFIPFSTLDSSRNRKQKGIGLGLAIVKMIMKKHQGKVTVGESDLGGAKFELRW